MNVYVSTGGFCNQCVEQTLKQFVDAGIRYIELSGGRWRYDLLDIVLSYKDEARITLHNYFPPSQVPFVFNLASDDHETSQKSIEHVRNALRWSEMLGCKVYSFHAGYLIDPKPSELGFQLKSRALLNRNSAVTRFVDRVNVLASEAQSMGIHLFIENNVLNKLNFEGFGINPLLMVEPSECVQIMNATADNVSMLLDVGHLKVSAKTLEFEMHEMFERCSQWIRALHVSENDGSSDTNQPMQSDDWFWKHIATAMDFVTVEVYGLSPQELMQQSLIAQSHCKHLR